MSTAHIAAIVKAKGIYTRQPSSRHFYYVRQELLSIMQETRAEDMAGLLGYSRLLEQIGHTVEIVTCDGLEMKRIRVKAAKFIFQQRKRQGYVMANEPFDETIVDLSDINDESTYYSGFLFVPSIAAHFATHGRMTATADACHCQGIGPQSYGTVFEVMVYDTNHHLVPIVFAHSVGTECEDVWSKVFQAAKDITGFDRGGRVTIVDQEKSIDSAYRSTMDHAELFLDMLHVKKNMGPKLGPEKSTGLSLFERAVRAPSRTQVDALKAQYGPKQKAYLSKFADSEIYRAYSNLQDLIFTSQGAESQMSAALRNNIRSVEPQQMLRTVVDIQRNAFLKRQRDAQRCETPVPPQVERHIAQLIAKGRVYQSNVKFVEHTDMMEATVVSQLDRSKTRRVQLFGEGKPPQCCAYSTNGTGFPCYHGCAVLSEKHGALNVFRFIDKRHLTASWKMQYEGVTFLLPDQCDVDNVVLEAARLVAENNNLHIPVALPPRGRPSKNTGKRKRSWFERGPARTNKRTYTCSLCGVRGHNARQCDLRQEFEAAMREESSSRPAGEGKLVPQRGDGIDK